MASTFGEDKDGNAVAGRIVVADKRVATQPAAESNARMVQDKGDVSDGDGGN